MTIAFIVVAAVAFIFLLVFNTKMARKPSPKKAVSPSDEDSRQRSKRPYPVEVEPKARELPDPDSTRETRHKAAEAGIHHEESDVDTNTRPLRDNIDSYGDQDYRAALRGFAGKGEEKEEPHKNNHGERETHKSEDEQYREALRSMNRKK
ncbi:hypothetical protein [Paenibacillus terrae]|uniref:Uncharacterized protein n=1 Tax=Paenibacillus terrae TaxID=159743 RepID=A0A0D7X784_9BACL|nr:hypothetical protein [Paenibacillus terrae]KJD47266.1 hypothetical protein QD47_01705 [Paenibacillus terrae]